MNHPVPGARVTSPFGARVDPITGELAGHAGVDFAVPEGTPVYAPEAGDVYRVDVAGDGEWDGNGNAVFLRSVAVPGRVWAFLHLLAVADRVSSAPRRGGAGRPVRVGAGEGIGLSGNTGRTTGPHLHLGCVVDGVPVDPLPLLALPAEAGPRVLHRGLVGADVKEARAAAWELLEQAMDDALEEGETFGPATERLVRAVQGAEGLTVDGWVGPATRRALG